MKIVCGIDEAGRGPAVGPMVICGASFPENISDKLKEIGVKDSKLLLPEEREELFEKVTELCKKKYYIIIISPDEIDSAVAEKDLNWLEARKTAEIINFLRPNKAIIDCPNPNTKSYSEYIRERLIDKKTEIVAEHKADFKYPVVGAASILAKVTRDAEIEKIKEKIGIDFGSGYPSDPKTKKFIEENFDNKKFASIIRHSWSPVKARVSEKEQSRLGDF
ncbi:MAG: ribonuclease HII [Candidatus Woesearchaeota archaeon]|nr:ribonuclease HII [Candidatus Woesearchaeota archaeon]